MVQEVEDVLCLTGSSGSRVHDVFIVRYEEVQEVDVTCRVRGGYHDLMVTQFGVHLEVQVHLAPLDECSLLLIIVALIHIVLIGQHEMRVVLRDEIPEEDVELLPTLVVSSRTHGPHQTEIE